MRAFNNPLSPDTTAMAKRFYDAYYSNKTENFTLQDAHLIQEVKKDFGFQETRAAIYTILQGFESIIEEANPEDFWSRF